MEQISVRKKERIGGLNKSITNERNEIFTDKRKDKTLRNNDEKEEIKKERRERLKKVEVKREGYRIKGGKKGVTLILRNEDIREGL